MKAIRINDYNPARGYTVQSYKITGSGYPQFDASRGWYEVSDAFAARVSKLRNNSNDPLSPPIFQVMTLEEADAIDEIESRKKATAKAPIRVTPPAEVEAEKAEAKVVETAPSNDLTTADLKKPVLRRPRKVTSENFTV